MSLISNSGHDENNRYSGGKAGDQTGTEWYLRTWYKRPWNCVLRHPNANVRATIADLGVKAARNNKIGYDQSQRNTYWSQLQKVGYDPSKITVACEADCSAGVIANVRATGYLLNIEALKNINASYTGNMRSGFKNAGFQVLTDSKYLTSPDYLLPGDILLNDAYHTATNIEKGRYATENTGNASKPVSSGTSSTSIAERKSGYMFNPSIVRKGSKGTSVLLLQEILKARGFKGADGKELALDRDAGNNTIYAINSYQTARRKQGVELGTNGKNDSSCGPKMWADLIAI